MVSAVTKQIKIGNLNEELKSKIVVIKKLKAGNEKNVNLLAQKKKKWKIKDLQSMLSHPIFLVQNVISYHRKNFI